MYYSSRSKHFATLSFNFFETLSFTRIESLIFSYKPKPTILPYYFKSFKNYSSKTDVRVRFAPSPTGQLHLGGLRTALFNYLYARKNNGKFILRIEDTDQNRLVSGAQEAMISDLQWAGLSYDEGPGVGGNFGPYVQSQRFKLYHQHIDELLKKNFAYRCFCSKERLQKIRSSKKSLKEPSVYDGNCRHLGLKRVEELLSSGASYSVRFKASEASEVAVTDLLRGQLVIKQTPRDDFILLKSDGFPTYHLANVVDDHLMKISHVLRGDEWLMSLPRHKALYEAFGWVSPKFVHLPLLHNPDGSKLSKRSGDVHVASFKEKGYLPESLINFIALLGWTPSDSKREFLLKSDLIQEFLLENINVSSPKVFLEKLRWLNQQHIQQQIEDPNTFKNIVKQLYPKIQSAYSSNVHSEDTECLTFQYIEKVTQIMKERTYFLDDLVYSVSYLFIPPTYENLKPDSPLQEYIKSQNVEVLSCIPAYVISSFLEYLSTLSNNNITQEQLNCFFESIQKADNKPVHIQKLPINAIRKALRLSLTDSKMGPPIHAILDCLGVKRIQNRIKKLINCMPALNN